MRYKSLSLAFASSLLIYSGVNAAGLGKLTVLSSLGQPLRAEIELTSVSREEISSLTPKMANSEAFRQANIELNPNLLPLHFSVENRDSRYVILITSAQSINEPFVEMLIELNSTNGRLTRQYDLLLGAVPLSRVARGVSDAGSTLATTKLNKSESNSVTIQTTKQEGNKSSAYYQVKKGDTLNRIASQLKPSEIPLEQLLVALQRHNQSSFIHGNVNLIRSGSILTIPTISEIKKIDQNEAKRIILAQSADFVAYRNRLANQAEQAVSEKSVEIKKTNNAKITAKVIDTPSQLNESTDKLKLSKLQHSEQSSSKIAEEDGIARKKVLETANDRIKELEQNTAKLQKILELQDQVPSSTQDSVQNSISDQAPDSSSSLPKAEQNTEVAVPFSESTSSALTTNGLTVDTAPDTNISAPSVQHKSEESEVADSSGPDIGRSMFDSTLYYWPYVAVLLTLFGLVSIFIRTRKTKPDHFTGSTISIKSRLQIDPIGLAPVSSSAKGTDEQSVELNPGVSDFNSISTIPLSNAAEPVSEADKSILQAAFSKDVVTDSPQLQFTEEKKDFLAQEVDSDFMPEELIQVETSLRDSSPNTTTVQSPTANSGDSITMSDNRSSFEFDLSKIDLELPDLHQSHQNSSARLSSVEKRYVNLQKSLLEVFPGKELNEELTTKLDLASAYQEIGDKDGARQLLDDVLKVGNQEQTARAKAMLLELG
ncbi:MAG: LysM peptidoglycan-binding protein [Solimicrobium sp.]|jgi:pilus assembly protein FimV|nr:LysM peptidoglycan-binding protein [Solimicrobium sp.]